MPNNNDRNNAQLTALLKGLINRLFKFSFGCHALQGFPDSASSQSFNLALEQQLEKAAPEEETQIESSEELDDVP